MRKTLLASASALVLSSSIALSADMAVKAPPKLAPVAPPSWTGFYAGLNAGYAWGNSDPSLIGSVTGLALLFNGTNGLPGLKPSGFIGGGQAGYNWQTGQFVWGGEVDFDGLDAKADASASPFFIGKGNGNTVSWSSRYDWLFTARLRGGVLVDPNWLLYITGGLAVTHVHDSATCTSTTFCGNSFTGSTISWSDSNTLAGGAVGGGVETRFAPHWTARVEFLYAKFKSTTAPVVGSTGFVVHAIIPPLFSFEHQLEMVRFAISYQFP
jgi:outer membrane immunogenic protein